MSFYAGRERAAAVGEKGRRNRHKKVAAPSRGGGLPPFTAKSDPHISFSAEKNHHHLRWRKRKETSSIIPFIML